MNGCGGSPRQNPKTAIKMGCTPKAVGLHPETSDFLQQLKSLGSAQISLPTNLTYKGQVLPLNL